MRGEWIEKGYTASFSELLIDSGAYSLLGDPTLKICLNEYADWASRFPNATAVAGLDSIDGDFRESLKNYAVGPGFPTFHDTDPDWLLDELIPISRERGGWLGIGIKPDPTRNGREEWLKRTLRRIPSDIHVHGWALRIYSHFSRIDSFDSTAWWQVAMRFRKTLGNWLTYAEALELSLKQIERETKLVAEDSTDQEEMFS